MPLSSRRYVIMDAFVSLTSEWARVYFITWHADGYIMAADDRLMATDD